MGWMLEGKREAYGIDAIFPFMEWDDLLGSSRYHVICRGFDH